MEAQLKIQEFIVEIEQNSNNHERLADIITRIFEHSTIINFAEFLELDAIKQLEFSELGAYYKALKMFSTGTLREYSEAQSELIPLTAAMEKKLRQLTVLSIHRRHLMSTDCNSILYNELQSELNFQDVRHMEDLIIEAVYSGIIRAKLDQKNQRLEIDWAAERDLQPQDYTRMVEELEKFLAAVEDTGFCFKELIEKSNAEKRRNRDLNELKQDRTARFLREHTRPLNANEAGPSRRPGDPRPSTSRQADPTNEVSSTTTTDVYIRSLLEK